MRNLILIALLLISCDIVDTVNRIPPNSAMLKGKIINQDNHLITFEIKRVVEHRGLKIDRSIISIKAKESNYKCDPCSVIVTKTNKNYYITHHIGRY